MMNEVQPISHQFGLPKFASAGKESVSGLSDHGDSGCTWVPTGVSHSPLKHFFPLHNLKVTAFHLT